MHKPGRRLLRNRRRRAAQFSLELMVVLAAYFALLAAFIGAENNAGKELSHAAKDFSNRTSASAACLFIDFFSQDARNTVLRLDELKDFLAAGHVIAKGNQTATCIAKIQGTGKQILVEQNDREPA